MKSHSPRTLAVALAVVALVFGAGAAQATGKQKSVSNEAEFVSFDDAADTVTVKIKKKGKGNRKLLKDHKEVKKGKEVTFHVIPTGSVLKRTSVAINGVKAEMTDLEPGKSIIVYWVEHESKAPELFARKIDVVLSEEELDKRYKVVDE